MSIAIGSDEAGFELKEKLKDFLPARIMVILRNGIYNDKRRAQRAKIKTVA